MNVAKMRRPLLIMAGGADRTETLYIELREKGAAIDPGPWFAETKEP